MSDYHAEISLGLDGTGRVMIHEHDTGRSIDISSVVNAIDIHRTPDGRTTATLHLPWASGSFLAVAAHVPQDTAEALMALGWTPPAPPGLAVTPAGQDIARRHLADTPEGTA